MATYLSIVNDSILESGADLDQFASDGSDFTALGHDSLMYKFKTWVARAWQTIQQNAYDWEFMAEQAVVNINPGIMFYSSAPIPDGASAYSSIDIYDVNGNKIVPNVAINKIVNLTGKYTDTENFGYVDVTTSGSSPVSFGMKAGGEYFYIESSPPNLLVVELRQGGWLPNVGDTVTGQIQDGLFIVDVGLKVVDYNNTFQTYSLALNGYSGSSADDMAMFVISNQNRLKTLSKESAPGFPNNVVDVMNATPDVMWEPYLRPQKYIVAGDVLYILGDWSITGGIGSSPPLVGDQVLNLKFGFQGYPGNTVNIANPGVLTAIAAYGTLTPLKYMSIKLTDAAKAALSSMTPQPGGVLEAVASFDFGKTVTITGGLSSNGYFAYSENTNKCYIHSWKSFDWSEETDSDDFVENIAELDEKSFRLVTHEIPAPGMEIKLPFMHWEIFRTRYNNATVPPSQPRIITKDSVGRYRTYPAPDTKYTLLFDYVRNPQQFTNWSDIPKNLPNDLSDIIMWRALMYYGEYDEQPSVVQRATRNYKDLLSRLELRFRDKFHFVPVRLY